MWFNLNIMPVSSISFEDIYPDHFFLGYVFSPLFVTDHEVFDFNMSSVIEDHIAAGGFREEINSFNLTYTRYDETKYNVSVRMHLLNYTFVGWLFFNTETYRYYDPNLGETKGMYCPFIMPIHWDIFPIASSPYFETEWEYEAEGKKEELEHHMVKDYFLSDDEEFQLKFQHNLTHDYFHMYKAYYHYPYGAGDFRISHFYQVYIRYGYFNLLLKNILVLANADLNEDWILNGRLKLWHTDLDLWSAEKTVDRLDLAPSDNSDDGGIWWVVVIIFMLAVPAVWTTLYLRVKEKSKKKTPRLPPRNQKYRHKRPRV